MAAVSGFDGKTRERAERREIELKLYEYGAATIREEGRAQGREEGREEGRAQGKQQTLLRQLTVKFGELPSEVQARIATAAELDLDRWLDRLLSTDTLDAVFVRG